ncbi:hypothetical protein R0K04_28975, partial [Pseudoalteromonas sp. SIMBA_153]
PLAVHLDDLLSLSNTIATLGERINRSAPTAAKTSTVQAPVATQNPVADHAASNADFDGDGGLDIDLDNEADDDLLSFYN